ncbi:hypothetical protein [Saccharopolyspora mangrovi]|uniref:Uncharacterized protein n=1 Tax=Saccharopolyspora mangrovi TaxID=3082379 RepID=A0ABU6AEQ9_9PSEU|nr:hypothetical protein [Saccharopolyspora sp. S2-29]MEB3369810.1 hypothetical protein [Saccharopolyspora sp. S2-29]
MTTTPRDRAAQQRRRTGWIMITAYARGSFPAPEPSSVDDPVLREASRNAVFWLGLNLALGKSDAEARENAYFAALRSAQDTTSSSPTRL